MVKPSASASRTYLSFAERLDAPLEVAVPGALKVDIT